MKHVGVLIIDHEEGNNLKQRLEKRPEFYIIGSTRNMDLGFTLGKRYQPDLIILNVDLPGNEGISAAEGFASELPTSRLVLLTSADSNRVLRSALRVGAKDVINLPMADDELYSLLNRVAEQELKRKELIGVERNYSAQFLTVFSTKGGVGKTTLALNLAVAIRELTKKRTLLVDLNLSSGNVALMAGVSPTPSIKELIDEIANVKGETLDNYCLEHPTGLRILPAPATPEPIGNLTANDIERVIDLISESYNYVVFDAPNSFRDSVIPALTRAQDIVLVTTMDLAAIQMLKHSLDVLTEKNMGHKARIVVNRSGYAGGFGVTDLEKELGMPVLSTVPNCEKLAVNAVNIGVPIYISAKNSPAARSIEHLASKLLAAEDRQGPTSGWRRFFARGRWKDVFAAENAPTAAQATTGKQAQIMLQTLQWSEIKDRAMQEAAASIDAAEMEQLPAPERRTYVSQQVTAIVDKLLKELSTALRPGDFQLMIEETVDEIIGLGPITRPLEDESVSEIMVNGPDQVYVERNGKLQLSGITFRDNAHLMHVIQRIIAPLGKRIDEASPTVDARLPDGSRVNAVIPPLSLNGPLLTIRKFSKTPLSMSDLIDLTTVSPEMASFLQASVEGRQNIIIGGGTGTGKTTMLNVLSSFIPNDERIVTVEDSAELKLQQEHVIRLEARQANIEGKGRITIRDMVINSLRMRPDRIIVGEVRGGEALDMLQAMNTGNDGSLTTGHANSPRDLLARLETMVLMAGIDLPVRVIREQIAAALNLIVYQSRFKDGSRKVTKVTEVLGMEGDAITLQDLFVFEQQGAAEDGRVLGCFRPTGVIPMCLPVLEAKGIHVPASIFTTGM